MTDMTLELQVGKRYRTPTNDIYIILGTHKNLYYGVEETDGACVRFNADGSSYYPTGPRLLKEAEIVYLAMYCQHFGKTFAEVFGTRAGAKNHLENLVEYEPIGVLEVDLSTCQPNQ